MMLEGESVDDRGADWRACPREARRQLGRTGAWLRILGWAPWREASRAARRLDAAGFETLWISDGPAAKEPMAHAGMLLRATERVAVATGIASIWARDPLAARNAALALAEAHPGRFALGLGSGHATSVAARGHRYRRPLAAMEAYLDGFDAVPWLGAWPSRPVPVLLGGLRERMLRLAAARTSGAHPYFGPVSHTAKARAVLGPGPILAPEAAFVLDGDPERARTRARVYTSEYLELANYRAHLRELGYAEHELDGGGSDRLVDDIVIWGDEAAVARRVRAHRRAGADHVCLQPVGVGLDQTVDELLAVAPHVLEAESKEREVHVNAVNRSGGGA